MTEIIADLNMARFRHLKGKARKEKLRAIAERLTPLQSSQIGMMVDTNDLEAAHRMMERHNQKAYNEWREKYKSTPVNQRPQFKAPFWWDPQNPQTEQSKWTSQLKEAFAAHG